MADWLLEDGCDYQHRDDLLQHYHNLLTLREALSKPLKSNTNHNGQTCVNCVLDHKMQQIVAKFVKDHDIKVEKKTSKPTAYKLVDDNECDLSSKVIIRRSRSQEQVVLFCHLVSNNFVYNALFVIYKDHIENTKCCIFTHHRFQLE